MSNLSSQITINLTYVERDRSCTCTFLLLIPFAQPQDLVTCKLGRFIITARKRSLRRLCFHRCLSVHRGGCLPHCMLGYTPPRTRGRHPLPQDRWQTPPWADTPWADTPWADTPSEQTPHRVDTPLRSACWDTVNKRAVRIPLECILVHIGICGVRICDFLTWIYNFS